MVSAINSALSGLAAAGKRLDTSANNIANEFSTRTNKSGEVTNTPYVPQRVLQVSQETGGTLAKQVDVEPATVTRFDPTNADVRANGTAVVPNVDVANELIQQKLTSYDFKANLKTIKIQDNLDKSLLDIIT